MKYQGSKWLIAKYILPIILKERGENQTYVEPFVGGANMIDKVKTGHRMGFDSNHYVIEVFKALQRGWSPPTNISESIWRDIKGNKSKYPPELVGFVGICCSFGGKWFNGYAHPDKRDGKNRALVGTNNLLKQTPNIQDVEFDSCRYEIVDFFIPNNSLIYCDPPYNNTTKYKDSFDSELFYDWCRMMVKKGHTVFVSEYSAHFDFELVFEKGHLTTLSSKCNKSIRYERLYRVR